MDIDYLSKIKENISNVFSDIEKINYDYFEKSFNLLSEKGGFEKLFNNLITRNEYEPLRDIITEFNFITQILQLHPNVKIQYEPEIPSENRRPDLRIIFNGNIYIIQVKRMRRSLSYENNEQYSSGRFVRVDDIPQLQSSLVKSVKNFSIPKGAIFLVAQEISPSADIDYITQSETVFGKEQYVFNNRKSYVTRAKTGFFSSEQGQSIAGYIDLKPKNNGLFYNYQMTLFLNKLHEEYETNIKDLLIIETIYKYENLP